MTTQPCQVIYHDVSCTCPVREECECYTPRRFLFQDEITSMVQYIPSAGYINADVSGADGNASGVQVNIDDVGVGASSLEVCVSGVETVASGVQVNIGDVGVGASSLEVCVSGVEAVASGVQVNIGDIGVGASSLEVCVSGVEAVVSGVHVNIGDVGVGVSSLGAGVRGVEPVASVVQAILNDGASACGIEVGVFGKESVNIIAEHASNANEELLVPVLSPSGSVRALGCCYV